VSASPSAPRIIPRDQHCISRKQISPNALRVLYRLQRSRLRRLSGRRRGARPAGRRRAQGFRRGHRRHAGAGQALFRNCRLIGRRFRLAHVVYGREIIEVATFRANSRRRQRRPRACTNGRLVRDNVYGSIEDDAVRRDFTANALYYAIEDFSVRDYVGGYEDVQARVLRLIGDPEAALPRRPGADAARGAAGGEAGFRDRSSDGGTDRAPQRPAVRCRAGARLFEESLKLFLSGHGEPVSSNWSDGLLPALLPETAAALAAEWQRFAPDAAAGIVQYRRAGQRRQIGDRRPSCSPCCCGPPIAGAPVPAGAGRARRGGAASRRRSRHLAPGRAHRLAAPLLAADAGDLAAAAAFRQRQRKRVFRLLAHPRFRAAFDFLELRASVVPELAAEAAWWREAQGLGSDELAGRLVVPAKSADDAGKPRKRRRRRSGRGKAPVAGGE
jgi:poly(A) polymerase